jgi:hypothetical protein
MSMAEHVELLDLGVIWEPNAPDATLLARDDGTVVLALRAHPDDEDQRCVVLVWAGAQSASMAAPNDEAISGHRLIDKGLRQILWAGVVVESQLTDQMERQNRVHPSHDSSRFDLLKHHVVLLKECTVEVLATSVKLERRSASTAQAMLAALAT